MPPVTDDAFCFMKKTRLLPLWLGLISLATTAMQAADPTLHVVEKDPPDDLAPAIREKLRGTAFQLLDGGRPSFEFWFVTGLPLQSGPSSPAKALDAIQPATLLGAVVVSQSKRDYRDDELQSGTYTMRFGVQPKDDDHQGSAQFPYFTVLIPAKRDPAPDAIKDYKRMVKASSKETTTGHPLVLSLRPSSPAAGDAPKLAAPIPNHKTLRVAVPAKITGEEKPISLEFEIVFQGMGHK
jgi:hypothetical protein